MKTIEYCTVDKGDWPRGPWGDEVYRDIWYVERQCRMMAEQLSTTYDGEEE